MNYKVNDEQRETDGDTISVSEVLRNERVQNPDMVAVQLNGEFLNKALFDSTLLKEGCELDFVYFMGGGQRKFA